MRPLLLFALFSACCVASCNNPTEQKSTAMYPRIDTISVGMRSDSGNYAIVTYYVKRLAKDTVMFEGSADNKIGKENWKVVSIKETLP